MIRVTLRQIHMEALIGCGLLAVLAIVIVVTGINLAQVNDAFQTTCNAAGNCASAANPVLQIDQGLQALVPLIATVAPALAGLFFGAPLIARELETGTFRLAWTQSVTRRRWLAVKLGLVGLVVVAISGLLTWMVDWWEGPLDSANQSSFDPGNFGFHGCVPIGYAAFAFALGVTTGVFLRRTVAAMGATLVGFVLARLAVQYWIRPNLISPVHKSLSLASTGFGTLSADPQTDTVSLLTPPHVTMPNTWVLSTEVVNHSGHALTSQSFLQACPGYGAFGGVPPEPAQIQAAHAACIRNLSATFHTVVTYQPASRFWPFQWAELGVFVAAALALCGLTYWWLQRRHA
jgi:hypothetical protein